MNLGAEPKRVAALSVLALVGGYVFYTNVLVGPDVDTRKAAPSAGIAPAPVSPVPSIQRPAASKNSARVASQEFRPTMKYKPGEVNYASIDPSIRLDLLSKVQSVAPEGGSRSLFQFSAAPAPDKTQQPNGPIVKPQPRFIGPELPPNIVAERAAEKAKVPPPPPPLITLKFYGYSTPRADGQKRAFFLDGDDIFVAAEGELVKKRYRVVQIGVNSVVMEDTQFKNNRQTLIIQAEQAG